MSRPLFQTSWFDPTFVFATSTLFSVVFIEGKEEDQSFDLRPLSEIPAVLFDYVLDPVFFAGLVVLLAARHLVGDNAKPMTDSESRSAGWYLWNAVIIHVMMDGFAGGHWGNRLLAENYKLLDVRFKDSAHPAEAASACLIVNMELFFHSLLTVIAYVGVVTKSAWRYEAEIVALVVQLVGTFFFVLPEFMTGCLNMVPQNVPGCIPAPTAYNLFYFYFGVGVNAVWVVVPLLLLKNAVQSSIADRKKQL